MDGRTLADAMGHSLAPATYNGYVDAFNAALAAAQCTTVNRAAMFCAQVGHESAGLHYMEEIASGAAYEGRRDLGNTQPGDGRRFKGRGPIQLTGRSNYQAFSRWCFVQELTPDINLFVRQPDLVAQPRWGFLAAAWYWTVARTKLNTMADAGDIVGCTRAINGGTNGLTDRTARWNRCRSLGNRLLPTPPPAQEADMSAGFEKDSRARWPREDLLERDLRADLAVKQGLIEKLVAGQAELRALVEKLVEAKQ